MTQEERPEHDVGERCCLDDHRGTVQFVGNVPPTKGQLITNILRPLNF